MAKKLTDVQTAHLKQARGARMVTPTGLTSKAVQDITGALDAIFQWS